MGGWQQLKLLLWKDYLIRKRKWITLAGVVWATGIMLALYIVRVNVDNVDYPTCQFPARALPSAGLLTFMQSFVCSVNNECEPMDTYDEIPTYESSKLTQLSRKFSPLISNETVLETASVVPDALKLVSKLAEVADEPTFLQINKNGLRVGELFLDPNRAKRYLSKRLELSDEVMQDVMDAQIGFQGIFQGFSRCNQESMSLMIQIENPRSFEAFASKLCSLTSTDVQNILMDVLGQIDFNKYIKMVGNMYYRLEGDSRLRELADTVTAVLRMTELTTFLPTELATIFGVDVDFTYFDITLLQKFLDLFKPTFSDTESYKSLRELADTAVSGVQFLSNFIKKQKNDDIEYGAKIDAEGSKGLTSVNRVFSKASEFLKEAVGSESASGVFKVISQIFKLVHKLLPDKLKHDVLLYSTLLTKLIESANKVVKINTRIEEVTYDVSLRHPEALKILVGLPAPTLEKGFDALTDAEKTQLATSRIDSPGQMFCDLNKLQTFFSISKNEAMGLKNKLCTDVWKNYVKDLVRAFGVYDVQNNINQMASIFIQETLGRDTSDSLYSLDYDFEVLESFVQTLSSMEPRPEVDWSKVFNVGKDSEFMKVLVKKSVLAKQILITVHGSLAKAVVKQNLILSYKLAPLIADSATLVTAIIQDLQTSDQELVRMTKELYPSIVLMVLMTALDDKKTYLSLSTHSEQIFCQNPNNVTPFVTLPQHESSSSSEDVVASGDLVRTLCGVSRALEIGLKNSSAFGKAITKIKLNQQDAQNDKHWTVLISGLKELYVKLEQDYPYLFRFADYGMDEIMKEKVEMLYREAKEFWFGEDLGRSIRVSLKLGFRILDLIDKEAFGMTGESWGKIRYGLHVVSGALEVIDDFVVTFDDLYRDKPAPQNLPPITLDALSRIVPNIPSVIVDSANLIVEDKINPTELTTFLNTPPYWPCANSSLAPLLDLSANSSEAVQGVETVLCGTAALRREWERYLVEKHVVAFDLKKYNTTPISPHIFLRASSSFDKLINVGSLLVEMVQDIFTNYDPDKLTWAKAGLYVFERFNVVDRDEILRNFFTKVDTILNSLDVSMVPTNKSLNDLLTSYVSCMKADADDVTCPLIGRAVAKVALQVVSVVFENGAEDMLKYLRESNEPNASILQLLGFTRGTPLYDFKEKLPDLVVVLLNSYLDFGFMSQIRRASLSEFWDCPAVVEALNPAIGSVVDATLLSRIEPYVCPQLLYWVSLPRGENTIIDVIAKPNHFLFSAEANTFNSSFLSAYNKTVQLTDYLIDIAKKNITIIDEEDIKLNTIENKLKNAIDKVINYKINENDPGYIAFSEMNKKQYISMTYLTRVVLIVNKIMAKVENLTALDLADPSDESGIEVVKKEILAVQNLFRRKPHHMIELHFDVITNLLWTVNDYYSLVDALNTMCTDLIDNDKTEKILVENDRVKRTFCTNNFMMMYKGVDAEVSNDLAMAKMTLMHFVTVLQNDENLDNITDIIVFLENRPEVLATLKKSIKYSYELSIPIYLKYLQDVLLHCDVITSFLSGDNWWGLLRELYNGPYASSFLDAAEMSFDVANDVMENLDRIHIIRLIHNMRTNDSDEFCDAKIELSDYFPDKTGSLSTIKRQLCDEEKTLLFREIPPLLFAAQGYDAVLKLSRDVDYTGLYLVLAETESKLKLIQNGPLTPQTPSWITDDKLALFREGVLNLLSKESLTKVAFGALSNLVDAGTLFLNNSDCHLCSTFTSWIKQLNLQVFKKQEYDALLCRLPLMTLEEVHLALQNDFHWDMAIRELISTRNYTKYELNKSMNEFLELVKLHLLEDITAPTTKLTECLARNVTKNEFGNATLFITVLSHTARLLRSVTPHLHQIEGFKELPYLNHLLQEVAHNLNVNQPLKGFLMRKGLKELEFLGDMMKSVVDGEINLRLLHENETSLEKTLYSTDWSEVCASCDCDRVRRVLHDNINMTMVDKELPALQTAEFWRFPFVSDILAHLEALLSHGGRLVGVASSLDVHGVIAGRIAPLLDIGLQLLNNETNSAVLYSLQGITEELHPLFENASLEHDLTGLGRGLAILHELKTYLINEVDLKLNISSLFTNPSRLEASLSRLGINNTNFWSLAAPRVHAGYIDLKPILISKLPISSYVCQMEAMSLIIQPSNLDMVTADDVYAAITDQFCGMDDRRVKEMLPLLLAGVDFGAIVDKLKTILLPRVFAAANLTQAQGDAVLSQAPQIAGLLPLVQQNAGDLTQVVNNEPIVKDLAHMETVGGLLGSPQFLKHAGQMVCGKPFPTMDNRFIRAIAQSQDFTAEPDTAQLDALPNDFCRDLYRDITNMAGGKIVWSFVKPLITGKILYTPANTVTNRIMQKANESFATMIRLTSLIHSFASSFDTLDMLASHRQGLVALQGMLKSPQVRSLLFGGEEEAGEGLNLDMDVDGLFERFGDFQGIGALLKKGSQMLKCFDLNRFRGVEDEFTLTHQAVQLSRVNEFSAGIVFLKTEQKGNSPLRVEYKLRMDIENVPTSTRIKNYFWIPGPEASFIEDMRYFRGFVQIQDLIDSALIKLSRFSNRQKREAERDEDIKWAMYTQQEPYPCYRKDFYQTSLYESQSMIAALFFSLLFTVTSVTRFIVAERDSGNTMLMSIMGVNLSHHTLSWFLASLAEMTLTCLCMTLVLTLGGILPRTQPILLFVLLLCFGVSVLAFCYMVSKLFSSASFGAVSAGIAYLITFMPFVLILSLEAVLSKVVKVVVCLSMSTAISYSFLSVARLEAMGIGCDWTRIWDAAPDDLSIAATTAMALIDALLYLAIGLLIDRYYGPKTLKTSIIYDNSPTEKAGVSIINVTKVYGSGRKRHVVVDRVSMELRQGHVTALLGHNGAGKTTLINILTGITKPTSGQVRICGRGAPACGFCPQRDVVIDTLTASEHVALYAQLKTGKKLEELRDQIDSIMAALSLGAVARLPVGALSGGTRRRVCVALAFAGAPDLVALDEPTAGVDPAARRDIWSMIVKLRENRTILMTTHHLDEAELLSDHIVIMHKGRVHTAGSPIEIKRSLGSGYRLTVTYPHCGNQWTDNDQTLMEERSKSLLSVVRNTVRNATLADISGSEVEITLPFFDPDGLNTNYTELCASLERGRPRLGYRGFAVDCSTLEQVFFALCRTADDDHNHVTYNPEPPSKCSSTLSMAGDTEPLVPVEGPLKGSAWAQYTALLHARYTHYLRNKWLLFVLLALPMIFITLSMAFALIRPPIDSEKGLLLTPNMYGNVTQYLVPHPSIYSNSVDPTFAEQVMLRLRLPNARNWTDKDTPSCKCTETRQVCNLTTAESADLPPMMMLPNVSTLNQWLVASHDVYVDKRFGGFTSSLKNDLTNFVAWYNNKGHHSLPAQLNELHSALMKAVSGDPNAGITAYTHPLKISKEQLSKDTVYQHVADAGISALVVVAYSLVSAGGALYLVAARRRQEKRLQLLCGVSPALYWSAALTADMIVIAINLTLTVIIFQAFGFPVFVARSNLPAICVLIILYGFACSNLIHVLEKAFTEASVANMVLFCGNMFVGLAGITVLLILDIISDSDATDNARRVLHKIFLVIPSFVLGDGLLEIAKNTIQAQVLDRFGMDTYKDPLGPDLIPYHYVALIVVGFALMALNLAIEYDYFEGFLDRFRPSMASALTVNPEDEEEEVRAERKRVQQEIADAERLRLPTIGNINAGFVDTESKTNSTKRRVSSGGDVAMVVSLGKMYSTVGGDRVAVNSLTLGIPRGQCTALLGVNGAGKSTTFAMLTGEVRPTAGHIHLNGRPVSRRDLCSGLISYCPQSDALDPLVTVTETLQFYCRLRGITNQHEVIRRTLEMFELTKYADVRTGILSGGNKRKVCSAIAVMGRAPLVLMDEPTSGMDPLSRSCVSRGALSACRCARGVVVSTHLLRDAARLARRVALLDRGRLRALAPLEDCLARFGGGYVIACRVPAGRTQDVWAQISRRAPTAVLQVSHRAMLHFLMPSRSTVNGKEVITQLSDIFRLMVELQSTCDIEDYTVNQSSLDQMFLSITNKSDVDPGPVDLEPLPSVDAIHGEAELNSVTSL